VKTRPARVNVNGALRYSVGLSSNGPSAVNAATLTDPAVARPTPSGVPCPCAAHCRFCPAPAATTVALMQGAGIVIPTMPNTGSVDFKGTGTADMHGAIANGASRARPARTNGNTGGNSKRTSDKETNPLPAKLGLIKT